MAVSRHVWRHGRRVPHWAAPLRRVARRWVAVRGAREHPGQRGDSGAGAFRRHVHVDSYLGYDYRQDGRPSGEPRGKRKGGAMHTSSHPSLAACSPPAFQLHPLVPLMCLASTLGWWVGVVCTFIYYFSILWDICSGLNLPLLTPVVNIYCDGVFDLCHLGHMRQFEQVA